MFIKIGEYSIPESSILFVKEGQVSNPDGTFVNYEINLVNGQKLMFLKSEETEILAKKLAENNYVVIKDENQE